MAYLYDNYGWYAGEGEGPRSVPQPPPTTSVSTVPGELRANWNEFEWVAVPYTAPMPPTPADPEVWAWFIDLGPFYDRFGQAMPAVLASVHPAVTVALKNISVRKWIDLQRQDVADGLAAISAAMPGVVTPELVEAILTTPVTAEENFALRKVYFT